MKTRQELKQIRIAAGYTQKDVAERAEISVKTVISYEKGRNVQPKIERRIRETIHEMYNESPLLVF